jgi:Ni/Fe-hydrogenase subunit HybB-like protein
LTGGPLSFNFWVGEILLGIVLPVVILVNKRTRARPVWRMLALLLVVGGVAAYRWDTNISGLMVVLSYLPGDPTITYTSYFPSLVEILAGAGIVSFGLLSFSLGVRFLNVVDHGRKAIETVTIKRTGKVPTQSQA